MNTKPRIRLIDIVAAVVLATWVAPLSAQDSSKLAYSSAEHDLVSKMSFRQLLSATLTLSRDLKDYDKYHCVYDPAIGPKVCDFMHTTSGQYEDFYQSTMSSCTRSELCEGASLGITTWDYLTSDKRICKHLVTGSCGKQVLNEQDVRQELLDLMELRRKVK
jgi:hypothetical protein